MATPGQEIEAARKALGLSRGAVAAAVGINESTVYRIETGRVQDPSKIGVIQSYLRIGPYGAVAPTRGGLDLAGMSEAALVALQAAVSAEIARRLAANAPSPVRPDDPPTPRPSEPGKRRISPNGVPMHVTEPPDIWGEDPAEQAQERREG